MNGGGDSMSGKPELAGQTVVVIGGSSGIGLEMARRCDGPPALLLNARRRAISTPRRFESS